MIEFLYWLEAEAGIGVLILFKNLMVSSLQEPQQAFHSRIAFCLNTHNEAVKALRFPPDAHKKELESAEKRRERQQQEQELAKHIAEEDDDEF